MKNLFALSVVISFLVSCSAPIQNSEKGNIEINLKLNGLNQGKVVLEQLNIRERIPIDTFEINPDGTVKITANSEDYDVFLAKVVDVQGEIIFVAKKGDKVDLTADAQNISGTYHISGTDELNQLDKFIDNDRDFALYRDSLNKIYLALKERNEHFTVEEEFNELYKKKAMNYEVFIIQYLKKNPDLFSNILTIRSLDRDRFPQEYQKVLKSLKKNFPENQHVKAFSEDIEKKLATEVGGKAAEFVLPGKGGKAVKLSDFKGKYVLLDFWATWCKPCIAEIPNLKSVYKKYKNQNFEIISVCIDKAEFKPTWEKIIAEHQANWVQLFDAAGQTAESYSIEYFPTILLLDQKGNIVAKNIRGEEIGQKVQELINGN